MQTNFGMPALPEKSEMKKGLVSIITPCYNDERYIAETIESVLSQTYPFWEMIIVDDGSADGSAEIVRGFLSLDSRIRYFRQDNAGSASARNTGIRHAQGQYIALLDADDLWLPDFLASQISLLKKTGSICAAASYKHIDGDSHLLPGTVRVKKHMTVRDMKVQNHIGCLTGLYDCSKYGTLYLPEELGSLRDDYAFWFQAVSLEGSACGNQRVLAKHRLTGSRASTDKTRIIGPQYRFYRKYLQESPPEAAVNLIRWALSGVIKHRHYYLKTFACRVRSALPGRIRDIEDAV